MSGDKGRDAMGLGKRGEGKKGRVKEVLGESGGEGESEGGG